MSVVPEKNHIVSIWETIALSSRLCIETLQAHPCITKYINIFEFKPVFLLVQQHEGENLARAVMVIHFSFISKNNGGIFFVSKNCGVGTYIGTYVVFELTPFWIQSFIFFLPPVGTGFISAATNILSFLRRRHIYFYYTFYAYTHTQKARNSQL